MKPVENLSYLTVLVFAHVLSVCLEFCTFLKQHNNIICLTVWFLVWSLDGIIDFQIAWFSKQVSVCFDTAVSTTCWRCLLGKLTLGLAGCNTWEELSRTYYDVSSLHYGSQLVHLDGRHGKRDIHLIILDSSCRSNTSFNPNSEGARSDGRSLACLAIAATCIIRTRIVLPLCGTNLVTAIVSL